MSNALVSAINARLGLSAVFAYKPSLRVVRWLASLLCIVALSVQADGYKLSIDGSGFCGPTFASSCYGGSASANPNYASIGGIYSPTYGTCSYTGTPGDTSQGGVWGVNTCAFTCPVGQQKINGRCVNPKQGGTPPCKENCAGNPINVGSGNKFQQERDYQAATGPLLFQRVYNGDGVARQSHFDAGWVGTYDRNVSTASVTPAVMSMMRADGKVVLFTLTNGIWVPDADVPDSLTQQNNGSGTLIGWTYKQASDDSVETYNASGQLIGITFRTGQTLTLTYSDGTTGANGGYVLNVNGNPTTTPLPAALLIRVADSFGRTLSFGYDVVSRVVKFVDPASGIYRYSYDTKGNLSVVTYPDNTTRTYVYNESANTSGANRPNALTGIIDENNNRFATWKYDTSNRALSSEHDLPGNVPVEKVSVAYTTDANGTVTSSVLTDALNTTRTYSFQTVLGVTKNSGIQQPCISGCTTATNAIAYDANGNVSQRTDFNGNVTTYQYNLTRNLETSRTEAYGTAQARTITTQWHATYRLPTLITEPARTTTFSYDANGNLLTKTITDTNLNKSRTWTFTYNALGQVLTADGPRTDVSDVTTYTYYSSASNVAGSVHSIGDLATTTNALGQITSITNYDLNGRPLLITDPNGITTTLSYDARGRLLTRTVNNTQTTTYQYDNVGQLIKVTLPDNSYLSYTFDTAHRLTDIADNAGNKIHYTLDAMGNRTQEDTKDPSNNILKSRSRVFDSLSRLQKDIGGTSPTTQITQYGYDNNGNLKTITDALNHITTNGYDALNRLTTITDPANNSATNTYNAIDQKTQIKDPRLVTTNYTIDALGNVTLTQSPDSGNTNKVYDAAGNLTQKTDARGVISNYTYDALNRITAITFPASTTENVSFTYDSTANGNLGKGHLTGYSNDGGATVLTYDAYGNVTLQTDMIGSVFYTAAWQYDSANRVSQITYPSGRIVIYTRNTLGQITQIQTKDTSTSAAVTIISSASYYPFGPLSALAFANGVTTTTQLDADYRASRITTNSTPVWDFVYSRDAASNITGIADQVSTYGKTFGYDTLNRVTSDVNNTGTWTYTFDPSGNRTQRVNTGTQTQTYATTSNLMTNNGSASQTFDANGNLITNGTSTYTYNNANRFTTYTVSGVVKAQMQYNAIGQRTAKLQITKPMHFHYDRSGHFIDATAFNSDGTLYQRYEWIYLDDTPVAQVFTVYGTNNAVSSRRTTYIHVDHLNTPRLMTDSTKKIVWRWDGDAFGKTAPNQNPDGDSVTDILNLRFAGQYYDSETGFYYNINRDYDPDNGRYTLSSDPIGLDGGLNPYRYAYDAPTDFTDPLGLCPDCNKSRQLAWDYYGQLQRLFPQQYPKAPSAILFAPLPPDHGGMVSPLLPSIMFLPESFCDLNDQNIFDFYWGIAHEGLHINQGWIDLIKTRGDTPAHDQVDQQGLNNTRAATGRQF